MTARSDQLMERYQVHDIMERLMDLLDVSCSLGDTEDVPAAINDPAGKLYGQITTQFGSLDEFVFRVTELFDPKD